MNKITYTFISVLPLAFVACTEPGKTTAVGAATGGAIGAGLGAIVGNQVGSSGAGLVIGGIAGASAGAAVGNALESHEKRIAANEEGLTQKDEIIKAQKAEIAQLRRLHSDGAYGADTNVQPRVAQQDTFAMASNSSGARYASPAEIAAKRAELQNHEMKAQLNTTAPLAARQPTAAMPAASNERLGFKDSGAANTAAMHTGSGIAEKNLVEEVKPTTGQKPSDPAALVENPPASCVAADAKAEVQKADDVSDSADKLFHLRRALRICPTDADIHLKLGSLYTTLNRTEDARFEYNEALKVDPTNQAATTALEKLNDQKTTSSTSPKLPSSGLSKNRY